MTVQLLPSGEVNFTMSLVEIGVSYFMGTGV
jgi:hypothetical protein